MAVWARGDAGLADILVEIKVKQLELGRSCIQLIASGLSEWLPTEGKRIRKQQRIKLDDEIRKFAHA